MWMDVRKTEVTESPDTENWINHESSRGEESWMGKFPEKKKNIYPL